MTTIQRPSSNSTNVEPAQGDSSADDQSHPRAPTPFQGTCTRLSQENSDPEQRQNTLSPSVGVRPGDQTGW